LGYGSLLPPVCLLLLATLSLPGYRLLNGEGDLLPGLVCDVYGSSAVLKLDGDGPAGFYDVKGIAAWLQQQLQLQSVYLKNR
jgi:23S rRNA (cytosine1962-C5)-methyltransferase